MLDAKTIEIVKATAPAVAQYAEAITRNFYKRMFEGDPQVKVFFNQAHQTSGGQQSALAGAICAYAANIDNLGALGPAVELIAQKHCSLGIKPEHYPIVGKHLLAAISDVLGEAVTPEILNAWGQAYGFLAGVLTGREAQIYAEQRKKVGGWNGYRPFRVAKRVQESDIVTSFYLAPVDGGALPQFQPGQYITLDVKHPTAPTSPRNYSLSDRPGKPHLRISVKREPGTPPGLVSNYLHDQVAEGAVLHVGPPCGEFTFRHADKPQRPIVLLSGGVGLTPILSMLKTLVHEKVDVPIYFLHAARNSRAHAHRDEINAAAEGAKNVRVHVAYDQPLPGDLENGHCQSVGFFGAPELRAILPGTEVDVYLCGPKPFMIGVRQALLGLGVPAGQIHFEFFGPQSPLTPAVK